MSDKQIEQTAEEKADWFCLEAEKCDAKREQAVVDGDLVEAEAQRKAAEGYRESERGLRKQTAIERKG